MDLSRRDLLQSSIGAAAMGMYPNHFGSIRDRLRGGAPTGVLAIRPAFNRTKQPYSATQSDGTNTQGKYVIRHKAFSFAVEGGVQFWFANRYSESNGNNAITVSSEYEYPYLSGNWVSMTFSGGAASVIIAANGNDVCCDTIPLSVPANAYIRTRTLVKVASAGMKWPILDRLFLAAASNEGYILSTSDLSSSAVPNADTQTCYGPVAISGLTRAPTFVAIFGDSIAGGAYGDSTLDKIGWAQKAINDTYPTIQMNTGGEKASDFVGNHNKRMYLFDKIGLGGNNPGNALVTYGTNDSASTATAIEASLSSIYSLLYYRNMRITAVSILTYTTSNDNWIDAAGQTPVSGYGVGGTFDTVNAWLASIPTYIDQYLDIRVGYQDANRKILTDGTPAKYVGDGIGLHPSEYGYTQIAASISVNSFINAAPLNTAAPPVMSAAVVDLDAGSLAALGAGASVTSWSDVYGTIATEATNPPTLVLGATPSGNPSVKFNGAAQKLTAPARAAINNMFSNTGGGYVIEVTKQISDGGGSYGRHWMKGGDRVGQATPNTIAGVLHCSSADAAYYLPSLTYGKWQIYGILMNTAALASAECRLDSCTPVTINGASSGTYVDSSSLPLTIGNSDVGTRGLNGEISRLVMWATAPSAIDREIAFVYLRRLAGITF